MKPIVFVEKIAQNSKDLKEQFLRSFNLLPIIDEFNKANAIFIKPNLTYPKFKKGVTTRIEFIESLVAALRQINNSTKIYIGEGEGGYNSFSMTEAMQSMGFYELEKKYQNIKVLNISQISFKDVELKVEGKPYLINLPELFFDEIDFSTTTPSILPFLNIIFPYFIYFLLLKSFANIFCNHLPAVPQLFPQTDSYLYNPS